MWSEASHVHEDSAERDSVGAGGWNVAEGAVVVKKHSPPTNVLIPAN